MSIDRPQEDLPGISNTLAALGLGTLLGCASPVEGSQHTVISPHDSIMRITRALEEKFDQPCAFQVENDLVLCADEISFVKCKLFEETEDWSCEQTITDESEAERWRKMINDLVRSSTGDLCDGDKVKMIQNKGEDVQIISC